MLKVTIPGIETYDERNDLFISTKEQTIALEHSLLSISKWEAKWHKPYLASSEKTNEEMIDYIRCMTVTPNVDPNIYYGLTNDIYKKVSDYINDPMTATTLSKSKGQAVGQKEIITSEIIYYWMITCDIPFECEKWHLNRLLMLIQVCDRKNAPSQKMSKKDIFSQNRALNKARKSRPHK